MNWLEKWWKTVTTEEYELTVWFVDPNCPDAEGNVTANKSKKVFHYPSKQENKHTFSRKGYGWQ